MVMRKLLLLALLISQSVMAAIVAPLPFTIVAGTPIQANPLQSNFNWLMNQTNANAAPIAGPVFTGTVVIPTLTVTGSATIPSLTVPTLNTTTLTVATSAAIPLITGATTHSSPVTLTAVATPGLIFNVGSGNNRYIDWQSSGSSRWKAGANATGEGGGNTGSDFSLIRYNDAGTQIDTPLFIQRSTGAALFSASPSAPTPATADNSTTLATTAFVKNQSYVATTGAQNITSVKTFTAGNEPVATNTAKAWATFDGTTGALTKGYNVTSVTRTGIGTYSINFTNAIADANYAVTGIVGYAFNDGCWVNLDATGFGSPRTTTVLHIETAVPGGRVDAQFVSVTVFD
jgi:hypothetical protein